MDTKKSTSAIRMKRMRKRKKEEFPNFQAEENKRICDLRRQKRSQMSETEKNGLKKYERDRKRVQRAKKNEIKNHITESPYRCSQTLGKAVLKSVRSLPKSPRKQAAVVSGLAKRVGVCLENKMEENMATTHQNYSKVTTFFFRPDIVYTCPGMKDTICVWDKGQKKTLQKHYMTMFLREAFSIFKEDNDGFEIGFSKFCSLRPKNVLLLKSTPSEQCKCKTHENFMLKLKALNYRYSNEFWEKCLCDATINSECWKNECEICRNGKLLSVPSDLGKEVFWKVWDKTEDRLQLITKENCCGDLFEMVIQDLPLMMKHVYLKRVQHAEFQRDKEERCAEVRILQVDFAMSYSCEYQNEVQSALWSRASVLLFTAATFFQGQCKTYVVCSDTTCKAKDTVLSCIELIYDEIIGNEINVPQQEVIWSDGPSSEFKNKFMVKCLEILSNKYKRTFVWKYFATAHGKGVVDGVGGNIKRLVRQKMMGQGGIVVQSAEDFARVASAVSKTTKILFISEEQIRKQIQMKKPWEKVLAVNGIKNFHIICWQLEKAICKKNAIDTEEFIFDMKKFVSEENLQIGDWVIVIFEGKKFPGEVISILTPDDIKVSVMHKAAGTSGMFKWPNPADCIIYSRTEIIKKITAPEVANSRGQFKFNDGI